MKLRKTRAVNLVKSKSKSSVQRRSSKQVYYEYLPKKRSRKWDPKLLITEGESRVFFSFRKGSKEIVMGFPKKGHIYQDIWMCESINGDDNEQYISLQEAKQLFGQINQIVLGPVMDLLSGFSSKSIPAPKVPETKTIGKSTYIIHSCDDCGNDFVATPNTTRTSCFECYKPRKGFDWDYCRECENQFQFSLKNKRSKCYKCLPK